MTTRGDRVVGEPPARLTEERHRQLLGIQRYYRAFSLVNGRRATEEDLFAGLP